MSADEKKTTKGGAYTYVRNPKGSGMHVGKTPFGREKIPVPFCASLVWDPSAAVRLDSASGVALHVCAGGDCGKEYPKAAFSPSQWKKGPSKRMSASCAHAKQPKEVPAPTSAQAAALSCGQYVPGDNPYDVTKWAEEEAAKEAARVDAAAAKQAAREEAAAKEAAVAAKKAALATSIGGWCYTYSYQNSSDAHSEWYTLNEDGSYSACSQHTALLEGICGNHNWKGTWSVDDDGVTVLIGGKEFGVFEAGTIVVNKMMPALSSRDKAVYRRSGLA